MASSTSSTYFSLPLKSDQKTENSLQSNAVKDRGGGSKAISGSSSGSLAGSLLRNLQLNPFEKHKRLLSRYQSSMNSSNTPLISEVDILKRNHKFLRDADETESWEDRLAKKYYDKLFKEYCLGDFSRYKTGAVGMRWRTKKECIDGKGHFSCANLKCDKIKDLVSWEVNFAYLEGGEKKNALVKIRLCPDCSYKLNYKKIKQEKKNRKRKELEEDDVQLAEKKVKHSGDDHQQEESDNHHTHSQDHGQDHGQDDQDNDDNSEEEIPENIWSQPIKLDNVGQMSKEQEMEEYLKDLFA